MLWTIAIALGCIEGLTEFIPVSSTGHLLIADHFFHFERLLGSKEKANVFDMAIQAGAILAVVWIYWSKLTAAAIGTLRGERCDRRLFLALIVAFFPAAVVGLAFHKFITAHLFSPVPVACALIGGGLVIALIERIGLKPKCHTVDDVGYGKALAISFAQTLSLFPGVSRSGATIMGALCAGLDRPTATEFSFLLAVPTMLAATGFDLVTNARLLDSDFLAVFFLGFFSAYLSAWLVVRWLIRYVQHHNFEVFAIYRIICGVVVLAFLRFVQ